MTDIGNPEAIQEVFHQLEDGARVCLLYRNQEEKLVSAGLFIQQALQKGGACVYLLEEARRDVVLDSLLRQQACSEADIQEGRLLLQVWLGADSPNAGNRKQHRLETFFHLVEQKRHQGFEQVCLILEMSFSPEDSKKDTLFYEAELNKIALEMQVSCLCCYDMHLFNPDTLFDVLLCHRHVIDQNRAYQNPCCFSPQTLLLPEESQERLGTLLSLLREHTETIRLQQESQHRYQRLLSAITSYAYTVELEDSRVVSTHHGAGCSGVTGYEPEDYDQDAYLWLSMIHEEDRDQALEQVRHVLEHGHEEVLEHRIIHRDGTERWVRNTIVPYRDRNGQVYRYDGVMEDISAQKEAEADMVKASRLEATATLAGGIAHDFNNLMMSVMGNAELLRSRLKESVRVREMLDTIIQSAEKAGELAQQMLAYSQSGKYQNREIKINEVLKVTLSLLEIPNQAISVSRDFKPHVSLIEGDPTQVHQIALQILRNAIEAIPDKGTISVQTFDVEIAANEQSRQVNLKPGHYAAFSITDTGEGMTESTRSHIFEPFFTTKFQGRGLGLSAVYGIVENHQGHVSVVSREGEGSTFTVYLPARQDEPTAKMPQKEVESEPVSGEQILVIAENAMLLTVTRNLLERLGYVVETVQNWREALAAIEAPGADVGLVFWDISDFTRYHEEQLCQVRNTLPDMKIMVAGNYNTEDKKMATAHAGADCVIPKPYQLAALSRAIRELLTEA